MVRNTMVFKSNSLQICGEHPTFARISLARHSSQIEKINLKDFVTLAERRPFSSPTRSSLLQYLYGFLDRSSTFCAINFLRCRYFLVCLRNSGVKYEL